MKVYPGTIRLYLEPVEEAKSMIVPMQDPVEDRGKTGYEHVVLQGSVPVIAGTTMKVTELVSEVMAYGWSPEELRFQHPYLTMGQIHSALAYYWDHAEDLDREIERSLELGDQLRRSARPSPLRARLKAKGLL